MRILVLGLFISACVWSQPFSFGVKGGVPLTDFISVVNSPSPVFNALVTTNRYIIGPTAELRLPLGLGVEFDALYRHFNANADTPGLHQALSSGDWEFPLLAKYRFPVPIVKPYVDAGVAWDRLSGLTQTQTITGVIPSGPGVVPVAPVTQEFLVHSNTVAGFVMGGGVDVHALVLHISPEVRYTRWNSQHFTKTALSIVQSNQNQVEFLVGLTF